MTDRFARDRDRPESSADSGLPTVDQDAGSGHARPPKWATALPTVHSLWVRRPTASWPGWRPVASAVLLAAILLRLVTRDGGRFPPDVYPALWLALTATVVAWPAAEAWPQRVRWIAIGWGLGPLVALLFGGVRSGWVPALSTVSLAVPVALLTSLLWRRRSGPAVVGTIVAGALALSWYLGLLSWWGGALGRTRWLSLAAPNQSGPLMASLGFVGLGMAIALRGWRRSVGIALSIAGFSATWLSGSRASILMTIGMLAVVLTAVSRQTGMHPLAMARRHWATLSVTVTLVAGLVVALTWTTGFDPAVRRFGRDLGNLVARVEFWPPAVRMFLDAPLTGAGPGSFRWAALPHWPDTRNLTSSAHNEYLQVLAEGGLVWAVPVWAAMIGTAFLLLRAVRDQETGAAIEPGRRAAILAAIGTAGILGLHAGFDFDWDFPVLLVALATSATVLLYEVGCPDPERPDGRPPAGPGAAKVAAATLLLSVVALAGSSVERQTRPVPWHLDAALQEAVTEAVAENLVDARQATDRARWWNPNAWELPAIAAVVDHAGGTIGNQQLADVVLSPGPRGLPMAEQALVGRRLLEADAPELTQAIIEELRPVVEAREAWGIKLRASEVSLIATEATLVLSGCRAAEAAWTEEWTWLRDQGLGAAERFEVTRAWLRTPVQRRCEAR